MATIAVLEKQLVLAEQPWALAFPQPFRREQHRTRAKKWLRRCVLRTASKVRSVGMGSCRS